jgi:hypothetical protein
MGQNLLIACLHVADMARIGIDTAGIHWVKSDPIRVHGISQERFDNIGTDKYSVVTASITELGPSGSGPMDPYLGQANMSILNVVPDDVGNVHVRYNVDWPSDLNVQISMMYISPTQE